MQPSMWKQMLWAVEFLGITYVPLQCVVLWKSRGAACVAAVLPLLFMVPMIVTAVCSTVTGLLALASCLFMMKSGGPDFLVLISIPANVMLIGLAVLQWVV